MLELLTAPFRAAKASTRQFLAASLSARIAWVVALLQILIVILTVVVILVAGGMPVFQAWWTPGKALAVIGLLILVPLLVYYAARLWLQHETDRWPDIDKAWLEALVEVDRQGIDIRTTPLFLVLGSDGREAELAFMGMSPISLDVRAAPPGSAPLHVYAGQEAIFVCAATIGETCAIAARQQPPATTLSGLPAAERSNASDRLRTLCERIRNVRQPVAPANGVIALLSVAAATEQAGSAGGIGAALGEDLLVITTTFGLRVPLTIVGTGIDHIPGFDEFLERLPETQRTIAMGKGFPVGRPPTPADLLALSVTAASQPLSHISSFLLDTKSLADPRGNRMLISMLGQLRLHVAPFLQNVMQRALATTAHGAGPPLLAGCYLVSATPDATHSGFGSGVFRRCLEVQGDLDWVDWKLARDRSYGHWRNILIVLDLVMLVAIAGIVWWRLNR